MTALYICYQSLLEPLTQTQVVAYLEGLSRAGYGVVLLTFEPRQMLAEETRRWRKRLEAKGITWYWRRYHRRPTVPATAWDILGGIRTGLQLVRRHRVRLVHARAHVPGVVGLALKWLTGTKLLFDVRGLMAEEYVDAGVWRPGGALFHTTKRVERCLVKAADGVVTLTEEGKKLLSKWYPTAMKNKPVQVIPCCVDVERYARKDRSEGDSDGTVLKAVYIGKLGGWYLAREMADFMAVSVKVCPGLQWDIWTQSDAAEMRSLLQQRNVLDKVSVGCLAADEIPARLCQAHVGLAFIKPCCSKRASSPTKVGEYLAAGLPVIINRGIGDLDTLFRTEGNDPTAPAGLFVSSFSEEGYLGAARQIPALLESESVAGRCRNVARRKFDLRSVGWPRYREMYQALIGPPGPRQ